MLKAELAAIGIVVALLGQVVALMINGAGHGWTAPFFFSLPLLLVYPIVVVRAFSNNRAFPWIEIALLMSGLVADVMLYRDTVTQAWDGFNAVLEISILPIVWIIYWLSWQVLIVVGLAIGNSDAD